MVFWKILSKSTLGECEICFFEFVQVTAVLEILNFYVFLNIKNNVEIRFSQYWVNYGQLNFCVISSMHRFYFLLHSAKEILYKKSDGSNYSRVRVVRKYCNKLYILKGVASQTKFFKKTELQWLLILRKKSRVNWYLLIDSQIIPLVHQLLSMLFPLQKMV